MDKNYGIASSATPRTSEIDNEFANLSSRIEILFNGIKNLEQRLSPVLRGSLIEKTERPIEEESRTAYGKIIRTQAERISVATNNIEEIIGRLGV